MSNKKYDVYGIGNALVDIEFQVSPDRLKQLSIEKGLMTLIEEDREIHLVEELRACEVKRAAGGSAANTIAAVAQFGGNGFYSCKVANDERGEAFLKDMKNNGVISNVEHQRYEGKTGICLVMVTPDADRTMNTYLGITSTFGVEQLVESELKSSEYLYIEGYLAAADPGRHAAKVAKEMAKKHGVKTALSFSDPAMVRYYRPQVIEMLGDGVDLLFCNEEEALCFTETKSIEDAREKLKEVAKSFCVTLGGKGVLVYDGKQFLSADAFKVDVLDTNGAGDMFAGAFLYGITHGLDFKKAAVLACYSSGQIVAQFGPRLGIERTKQLRAEVFREHS